MDFPRFGLIRQLWPDSPAPRPDKWVRAALEQEPLLEPVAPGDSVLITASSRGIQTKAEVLAALVRAVRARGGRPLILPAMGSHGGGTAQGQVSLLAGHGITEKSVGAPIVERMEGVEIGTGESGWPVLVDRSAVEARHILLVNRVSEVTEWTGPTESGLLKMSVVGLGRRQGAEAMHRLALKTSLLKAIQAAARVILERLPILGGVALLEDWRGRLRRVEAVPARRIFEREPELLDEARRFRPRLPFNELDLLVVDRIGKEISGTGVDTKVIGRIMRPTEAELTEPRITRIVIRDLTETTAGNAIGVGLADYTTRRVLEKIDFRKTAVNCEVGNCPEKGRLPLPLESDRAALEAALNNIGPWSPEKVRAAWIVNSADLERLAVSQALWTQARERDDLAREGGLFPLEFDPRGDLPWLSALPPDP